MSCTTFIPSPEKDALATFHASNRNTTTSSSYGDQVDDSNKYNGQLQPKRCKMGSPIATMVPRGFGTTRTNLSMNSQPSTASSTNLKSMKNARRAPSSAVRQQAWVFHKDSAVRKQATPRRGLSTGFYDIPIAYPSSSVSRQPRLFATPHSAGKSVPSSESSARELKGNTPNHDESDDSDNDDSDNDDANASDSSDTDSQHSTQQKHLSAAQQQQQQQQLFRRFPGVGNSYQMEVESEGDDEDDELAEIRKKKFSNLSVHSQHFKPSSAADPPESFILRQLKKKKRRIAKLELAELRRKGTNQFKKTINSTSAQKPTKLKFSLKEVISIVDNAIRSRETELKEEFGAILAYKLREQFAQYQKYTQDYVHQRMESSSFNYMS